MHVGVVSTNLGDTRVSTEPFHGHDDRFSVSLIEIERCLSFSGATMMKENAINFGTASGMSQSRPVEAIVFVEIVASVKEGK
jgi:hypothetical protein